MKHIVMLVGFFCLLTQLPELKAQSPKEPVAKEREAGFAGTVSGILKSMQGKWTIKSATLLGAELAPEHFELLTVDESGMTLNVQKRKTRFEFIEFKLESKTFIAKCVSPEHKGGLAYEINLTDQLVKIRYRVDGARIAPNADMDDDQLLIQTWKKTE